jgi:hypothetical protein
VKKHYTYKAIYYLCRRVRRYLAVATENELHDETAKQLILSTPLHHPALELHRLFLVSNLETLRRLPEQDRQLLLQQLHERPRIQLKVLVADGGDLPPIFGVYDGVAVGTMNHRGINTISFDPREVQQAKATFERFWESGRVRPLTENDL